MQIRAITPLPFLSLSLVLPTHTHTFSLFSWVMKFVWPVFSHSLCHKLTEDGQKNAAQPCSFSTAELNINAA